MGCGGTHITHPQPQPQGAISSVFSLGYMTSMLPAGILATSYSPKTVLTLGVAVWSIAQILSPAAAHVNLTTLVRA